MAPVISVIVPTHNRAGRLRRTLTALSRQDTPSGNYELIIVADGCSDDTATVVRAAWLEPAYTFIQIPRSGRAAARNRGAAAACGEILLFLDDDMEASSELVSAHIQAHDRADTVVLGSFPMAAPPKGDCVSEHIRKLWSGYFEAWSDQSYRFGFKDFCTGNVSVPRATFEAAGGFDGNMIPDSAGEDWELGYRLLQMGVSFCFAPNARAIHHSIMTWGDLLRRACEEGVGHAFIAAKHPELISQLPLGRLKNLTISPVLGTFAALIWRQPSLISPAAHLLCLMARIFRGSGIESAFWPLHKLLWGYCYFTGVRRVLPSWSEWKALR